MKKVLIIGMTSGVGGVETFISNLVERINKDKFKIDVLLFQNTNSKYKTSLKNANNVYKVHAINKNPIKYCIDIIRFYKTHKYDIIHLNECTAKLFVYCWPAIFTKETKIIVHSHNGSGKRSVSHEILKRWQNLVASEFWSCSKEASIWMFGKYKNIRKKTIKNINNGIDVDKYLYSKQIRDVYRKKLGIQNSTKVIGSVARFETQKNHMFIVDIFADYLKENADSLLILVGEGSLKHNVMDKVKNLGIENNVMFLGNRNDVPQLMQVFDTLLMPSLYEGLPFIGLEAQASGVPIIASDSVDKGLKITRFVHFLSLNLKKNRWSKEISSVIASNDRNESKNYVRERFLITHYDLDGTIKHIEELYSEL